ncbi:hypothetical protein ACFFV7_53285 [Nonomuraea spiralis]|uniref:Integral membrane protein n=1 Tax=Nonomuraea spiralis TaxID=46182 RepID=A0ABV5IZR0_9ACTN|nr:hypothetical protein GCM10010176_104820 [Nonomuraea spiralis]
MIAAAQLLMVMDGTIVLLFWPARSAWCPAPVSAAGSTCPARSPRPWPSARRQPGHAAHGRRAAGHLLLPHPLHADDQAVLSRDHRLAYLAFTVGIAVTATARRPPGTSPHDALTSGYTAGMLGAGAFYLAAILAAVLLLRPRPVSRSAEPLGSTPR